jgi:hypothetical protein
MIWETRGNVFYAERNGKAYLVSRRGSTWVLRWRWLNDTKWEVVSEFSAAQDAKDAVTT